MRISHPLKILLAILGLLALLAAGMVMRRLVLQAQVVAYGPALPFNLESALEFRYVKMLFEGQGLPVVDKKIQVPEGIVVRETYTIGAEYVYAFLARGFPREMGLPERVRWISAGWFCLGIPFLSLWLWGWLRSAWAAGIGGATYAVALSSVMRSTGQELSHENFALPLLIGHFALSALADSQTRGWAFGALALGSAAFLGWALATWDMIQFYVIVWAMLSVVRMVAGGFFQEPRRRLKWALMLLTLVVTGTVNPYLRAHGFVTSYAMLLAYGTGIGIGVQGAARRWPAVPGRDPWPAPMAEPRARRARRAGLRRGAAAFLALGPLALGLLAAHTYGSAYSHFLELLQAKLMFLNQKPADPSVLTFAQRILWSPALNSANWQLTKIMFPATLPLSLLAVIIISCLARWRSDPEIIHLLVLGGVSLLAFFFFMRFHVFLIIAIAALLGWLGGWACRLPEFQRSKSRVAWGGAGLWNSILRAIVILLLLAGVGAEAGHVLRHASHWGSGQEYLPQRLELVQWLKSNHVSEPVLANFGISAFLLTYADCPIVLHPKFESPEIRRRVQAYGEALFQSDEAHFRAWADRYGAAWVVYSLGEFAAEHPEWQMRYCVNALEPPPDAAARRLEYHPDDARYFTWVWGNSKYRLFRIIRRSDELTAGRYVDEAQADLARGNLEEAEHKATLALMHDPHADRAMKVLLHVGSLKEKGVKSLND